MNAIQHSGWATYRIRIRQLPPGYAEYAPDSAIQLRDLIADVTNVRTYNVATNKGWVSGRAGAAWALLNTPLRTATGSSQRWAKLSC